MEQQAIENLKKMLDSGQDNPLLRFGLGSAYLKAGEVEQAIEHLAHAVELDPEYSAAWKLYGKALVQAGDGRAAEVLNRGIAVAEAQGDVQAVKEMQVFLRRLEKAG